MKQKTFEKGQGIVEFVIVVPLIIMGLYLVIYSGRWMYLKLNSQNVAYSDCIWVPHAGLMQDFGSFEAANKALENTNQHWEGFFLNHFSGGNGFGVRTSGVGCRGSLIINMGGFLNTLTGWEEGGGLSFDPSTTVTSTAYFDYAPFISCSTPRGCQ